jgi:hypothetical protein
MYKNRVGPERILDQLAKHTDPYVKRCGSEDKVVPNGLYVNVSVKTRQDQCRFSKFEFNHCIEKKKDKEHWELMPT